MCRKCTAERYTFIVQTLRPSLVKNVTKRHSSLSVAGTGVKFPASQNVKYLFWPALYVRWVEFAKPLANNSLTPLSSSLTSSLVARTPVPAAAPVGSSQGFSWLRESGQRRWGHHLVIRHQPLHSPSQGCVQHLVHGQEEK